MPLKNIPIWTLGVGVTLAVQGCSPAFRANEIDPAAATRAQFVSDCAGQSECLKTLLLGGEWEAAQEILAASSGVSPTEVLARIARKVPRVRTRFFHYDAIVVPGSPVIAGEGLTSLNELRLTWALKMYRVGMAPYVVFSGGAVHNRFVEADVLGEIAIQRGLPAAAVVPEPWARHTTENVRYAAVLGVQRRWRRVLFVTDPLQAFIIGRLTRDPSAYGGPGFVRYYEGLRTVHLEILHCPTRGFGVFGTGRVPPAGAPRCP